VRRGTRRGNQANCGQERTIASTKSSGDIVPITSADIAFYRRYDGDLDALSRSADRDATMHESDWRLLEDLRRRAVIAARGNGSERFRRELEADLAAHLADAEALAEFRQIVAADLNLTAASV
jgi:hypothetical protein